MNSNEKWSFGVNTLCEVEMMFLVATSLFQRAFYDRLKVGYPSSVEMWYSNVTSRDKYPQGVEDSC